MRRNIILVVVSLGFVFAGVAKPPDIKIINDKGSSTIVEFTLNGYDIEPITIDGKFCSKIKIPGNIIYHNEKGYPELPKFASSLIVPDDGVMDMRIIDVNYETAKVNPIVPSKGNLKRNVEPNSVPYVWDNFYQKNAWFPEQVVELLPPFVMRDFRGQTIIFNPFQYNPETSELRIARKIVVEVYRKADGGENVLKRKDDKIDKEFCKVYENFFLNYRETRSRYPFLSEAVGNMLIITGDAFYDNLQSFVFWKRKKGIPVEICSVSVIGNNSTAIKNKIQSKYNSEGVTWVLLVGEANIVATIGGSYDETCDPLYGYLAGGDNYMDAFICRFSASSDNEVDIQVAKSIKYERYPPQGATWDWYHKGIVTATSEGSPADSTRANWLRDTLLSYTYTEMTKVYEPWGTDAMITNAVNEGRSILNHIGHGSETGFGSQTAFWFDINDIAALNNTNMLPFVFLVACLVGDFDAVTTCCCEAWMWDGTPSAPQGAIAVYGSSVLQSWVPPTVAQIHAMSLLKHETAVTVGGLCFNGAMHMYEQTGDLEMLQTWHIFGDASIDLRTKIPDTLLVTHNPFVVPGPTTFSVNVKDNNGTTNIPNALVCLWIYTQSPQLHQKGYTDANGNITFNINPQNPNDTMWVTVTKHNYNPYEGYALVQDVGMPAVPTISRPLDYARIPYLQPTLSFVSTDPNGDQLRYRVLWDEDPNFASPDSATTGLYNSGTVVNFVFPSQLVQGMTYWWKVKCTDPNGSGYWTQFTTKRSFTVDTNLPLNTCTWYQTTNAQFNFDAFDGTQVQGDSVVLLPTGQTVVDSLLFANFDSGMPSGWTIVNSNGDAYQWTTGTTSDLGGFTPPNYGSAYAYYSDDDAGSSAPVSTEEGLLTPRIYVGGISMGLELVYGYGYNDYSSYDYYRVRMRRFVGGSWQAWVQLREYNADGSGTETISLDSYLPCDSMQFEWYYTETSANWGWACAVDNVLLRHTYQLSNNYGTLFGTPVVYHDLSTTYVRNKWGDVVWHKATGNDSIGIQVEYYNGSTWQLVPNGVLPGNSTGFFTHLAVDTVKLTNVDTVNYNTLRLKASFYRMTKSPNNPALLDWELGNLSSYVGIAEDVSHSTPHTFSLVVSPNLFSDHLKIRYQIPDARYQIGNV
ncbi:MAG: C25 family cysteine peptidase, partial [bacterium]